MTADYLDPGPSREELDVKPGALVVEFGTGWCGHCAAARSPIAAAFRESPNIAYLRIEDGPGRAAGRSYRVRLWPTLVFLANGREVARVVRPTSPDDVAEPLAELVAAMQSDG